MNPPNPRLQLYCLMNAKFIMCGESGPLGVSCVTGTPSLSVNCTDPVSAFPIRADSLYMLKTVIDRATGERLSMPETLTERYLSHPRDTTRFTYVENTPDELLRAVQEMLRLQEEAPAETDAQRAYRLIATKAATVFRDQFNYVRKWGADDGFLGEGRLVSFVAERDMRAERDSRTGFTIEDPTVTPLAADGVAPR